MPVAKAIPASSLQRGVRSMIHTREVSWGIIALFVGVFGLVLIAVLVVYPHLFAPLAQVTGGWVNGNLPAGGLLLVIPVCGVLLTVGRLRPRDVGLDPRGLPVGAVTTLAMWGTAQLISGLASVVGWGSLRLDPMWSEPGALSRWIGFAIAMFFGPPLAEEVAIRGFLLPQLYLKIKGGASWKLGGAVLVSSIVFGALHLPRQFLLGFDTAPVVLAAVLVSRTIGGMISALIYLRTGNLFVAIGLHAIGNAWIQIPASPVSIRMIWALAIVVLLVGWPLLDGRRWTCSLVPIRAENQYPEGTAGGN